MVRHGQNGYLANSMDTWVEAIRRLAGDPELRRRMGRESRGRVEEEFSVAAGAARWIDLLNRLRQSRRAA
jgi:glycosyltransferase involved in cell wall biosynthesis